jgi:hypothetical protein
VDESSPLLVLRGELAGQYGYGTRADADGDVHAGEQ